MSEKRRLTAGRAAALAFVAIGATVVACDAPVATEPREVIEEAGANDAGQATDPAVPKRSGESTLARWFDSDAAPIVFVDDVHIETREDLPGAVRQWVEGGLRDSGLVAHVEVVRGTRIQGGSLANGAVLIFTGRDGPGIDPGAVSARAARAPMPLVVVDGQRLPYPEIPSHLTRYPIARAQEFIEAAYFQDLVSLDIESFEIHRGAAAAAYYGEEGASGVIDIVTKGSGGR